MDWVHIREISSVNFGGEITIGMEFWGLANLKRLVRRAARGGGWGPRKLLGSTSAPGRMRSSSSPLISFRIVWNDLQILAPSTGICQILSKNFIAPNYQSVKCSTTCFEWVICETFVCLSTLAWNRIICAMQKYSGVKTGVKYAIYKYLKCHIIKQVGLPHKDAFLKAYVIIS